LRLRRRRFPAARNLAPYWSKVDLGEKGIWYRIFAGHFKDAEEAERFIKEQALEDAFVRKTAYATRIGAYGAPEAAEEKIRSLRELGSPVPDHRWGGRTTLYVGAFLTREGGGGAEGVALSSHESEVWSDNSPPGKIPDTG